MSTTRIAVASTPLTRTLDEAVPAAVTAIEHAGRQGARLVCLPESTLPGHRSQPVPVPALDAAALEEALDEVARAAARAGVISVVGAERITDAGRENICVVIDVDGRRVGVQPKIQISPEEEAHYVAGRGRRVFRVGGLTIGVAICHEAFRHPETVRTLVVAGAQLVMVPHYVTNGGGSLPSRWCEAGNPYNEKALLCRALENSVYIAAANVTSPTQGSASCVIGPDGELLTQVGYGSVGVAVADIDLERADRSMALRYSPQRNQVQRQ